MRPTLFWDAGFVICCSNLAAVDAANASSHACPCVAANFNGSSYHVAGTSTLLVATPQGLHQRTVEYGSVCRAWDSGLAPSCNRAQPDDWCGHKWCFVDPSRCTMNAPASEWLPGLGLFYSYATCGSPDFFIAAEKKTSLQGKMLRFAFPAEVPAWHYRTRSGRWGGIMGMWLDELQKSAGFQLVERNITSTNSSKWDACVHDIYRGLLDLCPTASWVSTNRAQEVAFAAAVVWSDFRLLVKVGDKKEVGLFSIFEPFTLSFYCYLLLTIICTGICFWLFEGDFESVERGKKEEDEQAEENIKKEKGKQEEKKEEQMCALVSTSSSLLSKRLSSIQSSVSTSVEMLPDKWQKRVQKMKLKSVCSKMIVLLAYHANNIGKSTYEVLNGLLLGSGWPERPREWSGRIMQTGFSFFVVVTIAAYTANLAAWLVAENLVQPDIKSIDDCIIKGYPVCVAVQIVDTVESLYPNLEMFIAEGSKQAMEGLRAGRCRASIIPDHDYRARSDFQNCTETLVGGAILGLSVATPVSESIVKTYSYHTAKLRRSGTWERLHDMHRAKILDRCKQAKTGPLKIGPRHFMGMWIIYSGFVALALVVHLFGGVVYGFIDGPAGDDSGKAEVDSGQDQSRRALTNDNNGKTEVDIGQTALTEKPTTWVLHQSI